MSHRLTLLLALLATAAPATELVGRITLVGLGQPPAVAREGAVIELAPLGGGPTLTTVTDAGGRFALADVPPGEWELRGRLAGGFGAVRYLRVPPGEVFRTDLCLATRQTAAVATALWSLMALLIAAAFAAAMMLYGRGRTPKQTSAPRSVTVTYILWATAFLLFELLSPDMQPALPEFVGGLSVLLGGLLALCVVRVTADLRPTIPVALGAIVAGALLQVASFSAELPERFMWLGLGVGLLLWTGAAGWLLSLGLKRPSYLALMAVVAALVDLWSVFFGFTGTVMASDAALARTVVDVGTLPWPMIGSELVHGGIGWGDFLFLSLFLTASARFGLDMSRSFWALLAALTIGLVMAQVLLLTETIAVGLPALPFMSLLYLLTHWRELAVPAEERRRIRGFVLALVAVLAVLATLQARREPTEREEIVLTETSSRPAAPAVPWELTELARPPLAVRAEALNQPRLERFEYLAETLGGRAVVARGYLAWPAAQPSADGKLPRWPAVLHLPGGAGRPDPELARRWADTGLLALALDWSGAADEPVHSDLTAWPSDKAYQVVPAVTDSLLYHLGALALRGVQALLARPECDGRVVLSGEGWGGLIALAIGALDDRVTAVIAADIGVVGEGAGAVARDLAERNRVTRDIWRAAFAPERYAPRLTKPTLFAAATNNPHFHLPELIRLYDQLAGPKQLVLAPNAGRAWSAVEPAARDRWPLRLLTGPPGPAPTLQLAAREGNLALTATRPGATGATFWVADATRGWPGRFWQPVAGRPLRRSWEATVEVATGVEEVAALVIITDGDGLTTANPPRQARVADLALQVKPPAWPEATLAEFRDGPAGWRLADPAEERRATIAVAADNLVALGREPTPVTITLVTHRVEPLRQLGPAAAALELTLAPTSATPAFSLELVERFGLPTEQRFTAVAGPGERVLRYPLAAFRAAGRQAPQWPAIDALVARFEVGAAPVAIEAVRLVGPAGGSLRTASP